VPAAVSLTGIAVLAPAVRAGRLSSVAAGRAAGPAAALEECLAGQVSPPSAGPVLTALLLAAVRDRQGTCAPFMLSRSLGGVCRARMGSGRSPGGECLPDVRCRVGARWVGNLMAREWGCSGVIPR
jgi:hypothetical protein